MFQKDADKFIVDIRRNSLSSFQTPKRAGWSGSAPSTATTAVIAACEVMEGEERHPEKVRTRLERPGAGRTRRSEVRRDCPQGIFRRAMDVHVLKTGRWHRQMLLGKIKPERRSTLGAQKDPDGAAAVDLKPFQKVSHKNEK